MVRFTQEEYIAAMSKRSKPRTSADVGEELESALARKVTEWCDAQWPKWKIVRARTDRRSTLAIGCHDMTVFGPWPTVVLVELKRKGGKPTKEQQAWACELQMLGWWVCVVRTMEEFSEAVEEAKNRHMNHLKDNYLRELEKIVK